TDFPEPIYVRTLMTCCRLDLRLWNCDAVPRLMFTLAACERKRGRPTRGAHAATGHTPQRPDCVAGVGGLELRNVIPKHPFERSPRFAGNPAEFWPRRLFAFELRRWRGAARA